MLPQYLLLLWDSPSGGPPPLGSPSFEWRPLAREKEWQPPAREKEWQPKAEGR